MSNTKQKAIIQKNSLKYNNNTFNTFRKRIYNKIVNRKVLLMLFKALRPDHVKTQVTPRLLESVKWHVGWGTTVRGPNNYVYNASIANIYRVASVSRIEGYPSATPFTWNSTATQQSQKTSLIIFVTLQRLPEAFLAQCVAVINKHCVNLIRRSFQQQLFNGRLCNN